MSTPRLRTAPIAVILAVIFAACAACDQAPQRADDEPAKSPATSDSEFPHPQDPTTQDPTVTDPTSDASMDSTANAAGLELATFGAGCFWCVEAVLEQLDGVRDVTSGYMGGRVDDPTYKQVCSGDTGHAEVVQVTFDPSVVSYRELVEWFWQLHDPTTLNRQGADEGTQYRSAIFYRGDTQKQAAAASMAAAQERFANPIVTEITAASTFWPAELDHQDFYRNNRTYGYCRAVIAPKLDKLKLEK